jgi:hypothetical protein
VQARNSGLVEAFWRYADWVSEIHRRADLRSSAWDVLRNGRGEGGVPRTPGRETPLARRPEGNKLFMLWGDGVESIDLAPGKRLSKKGNDFTEAALRAGDVLKRAASPSGQSRFQCENK